MKRRNQNKEIKKLGGVTNGARLKTREGDTFSNAS